MNSWASIPGLVYISEFVSEEEEKKLVQTIDSHPFCNVIRRRQQFYGETYYHTTHSEPNLQPLSEDKDTSYKLPMESMQWLIDKIKALPYGLFDRKDGEEPTQCLVNEYRHNYGISSHFDDPEAFGSTIASVSLIDPIYFTMKKPKELTNTCTDIEKEVKLYLEPRSLLILQGEARYLWRHGITKARLIHHPFTDEILRRGDIYRRLSITIRKLLDGRKRSTTHEPFHPSAYRNNNGYYKPNDSLIKN